MTSGSPTTNDVTFGHLINMVATGRKKTVATSLIPERNIFPLVISQSSVGQTLRLCFLFGFFFFFWLYHAACRILVPQPRIELTLPTVEALNLSHWTTREISEILLMQFPNNLPPKGLASNSYPCLNLDLLSLSFPLCLSGSTFLQRKIILSSPFLFSLCFAEFYCRLMDCFIFMHQNPLFHYAF